jgi:hypothetical protein
MNNLGSIAELSCKNLEVKNATIKSNYLTATPAPRSPTYYITEKSFVSYGSKKEA